MFIAISIGVLFLALTAGFRENNSDRKVYDAAGDDLRPIALHTRQDLKLIVYLLSAIIIMLGIVAERIH